MQPFVGRLSNRHFCKVTGLPENDYNWSFVGTVAGEAITCVGCWDAEVVMHPVSSAAAGCCPKCRTPQWGRRTGCGG